MDGAISPFPNMQPAGSDVNSTFTFPSLHFFLKVLVRLQLHVSSPRHAL